MSMSDFAVLAATWIPSAFDFGDVGVALWAFIMVAVAAVVVVLLFQAIAWFFSPE